MQIDYLRSFEAIARLGSFRRAGQKLGLSQAALSRQVQAIEREIGAAVFDRSVRPPSLTEAGSYYLEVVERVLEQLDRAKVELASRTVRKLRISVAPWGYAYVPHLITAFEREQGHVPMDLRRYVTLADVVSQLTSGEIDVAFAMIIADGDYRRLHHLPYASLLRERYGLVLPLEHRLARHASVQLCELAEEEFILSDAYAVQRQALEHAFQTIGATPKVSIEARQELMLALVAEGMGVGVTTPTVAKRLGGNVAFVDIADPFVSSELLLVWSARTPRPMVRRFIDFVQANAGLLSVGRPL